MAISKANIGQALHSVADDHVTAVANDIFDEDLNKYQSEINAEVGQGDGVYDISAANPTNGNPTPYGVLSEALTAFTDTTKKKGGMTIKFIDSNSGKYVQYRLKSATFSTDEDDWEKEGNSIEVIDTNGNNDIEFADEDGNIVLACGNGDIETKNFNSAKLRKNLGIENYPTFDDEETYSVGDTVMYNGLLYKFTSAKVVGSWDSSVVEETSIFEKSSHPVEVVDTNNNYDFEIADKNGNVILACRYGGIKTKNFDSAKLGKTHWYGKKWYAYGTSLTDTENTKQGKYAKYVRELSGMVMFNKGIGGGGLISNRNIYNRIMDVTDGKTEADLITLECLANDAGSTFGTVTDTDNTTFLGSLAECIRFLQINTTAQIVVISSMRARYNTAQTTYNTPETDEEYVNKCMAMEKLCLMYGVYYINPNHAMGYYRKCFKNGNDEEYINDYYVDNIHHTELGGKIFGEYIWSKLKEIPLWHTTL